MTTKFKIPGSSTKTKPFVPRTKREKYLLRKFWPIVEALHECIMDHLPPCTSEEERKDAYLVQIRKKFPLFHKRISKLNLERIKEALGEKK